MILYDMVELLRGKYMATECCRSITKRTM